MPATGLPAGGIEPYLRTIVPRIKDKYTLRNKRIEAVRDRRLLQNYVPIPDEFRAITQVWHSPLIAHLLDQSSSIMGNDLPIPMVPPLKVGIEAEENASKREAWLGVAYKRLFQGGLYGRITDAQPADGFAVWQATMRMHRWGQVQRYENEEPDVYNERRDQAKKSSFPFVLRFVASRTFHIVDEDEDGLTEVLEITRRESRPVAAQYKLGVRGSAYGTRTLSKYGTTSESTAWPDTCEFVEYWNRDRFVYMVDGEVVKQGKHPYKRVPYYYAPFRKTSIDDPTYETAGLLESILESHDLLESLVAMQRNWGTLSAFPIFEVEPISDEVVEEYDEDEEIIWKLGGTVKPPKGYRWRAVPLPPVGQDLVRLQEFVLNMIDRVSLAPILQGRLETGISGPTASAQISLAKSLFGSALNNLGAEFSAMAGWMQEMIDTVIGETVPVWDDAAATWQSLGPADIKGYYQVLHALQPVIHLERMQKAIMWADAQARGAVDMNYYREEGLGLPNPEEHDKRVQVERLRSSPQYLNELMSWWMKAIQARTNPMQVGGATPPTPPVQPGGPGVPMEAGIGLPMTPGFPNAPMATPPQTNGLPGGLPPFQTVQTGIEMPPPG